MYNADIQPSMRHFAYFAVEIRLMVAATPCIFRKIRHLSELRSLWGLRCRSNQPDVDKACIIQPFLHKLHQPIHSEFIVPVVPTDTVPSP